MRSFVCIGCFLLGAGTVMSQEVPTVTGPGPHQRLNFYNDKFGIERTILSTDDWEIRRKQILEGFEEAAGSLPSRVQLPDLDVQFREKVETKLYTHHTIDFASEAGDRTPAYLYIPKGITAGEQRPGIVALHPTSNMGKGVVDGQSERPNRAYGKELAERGYVVIAPDYLSYGDYADYDFANDRYKTGTMKGIWNHMRCVDLLIARDDVDSDRIGNIGHSLGGHNAIFHSVFDERVKVIVTSCGWSPFHDYYGGKIKGWTSDRYMPSLRDDYHLDPGKVLFDFYELVGALAPRAFFSNSPLGDANFDYRGVEKAAVQVRRIYEFYGMPDRMRIGYPDADHDFPLEVREEAYRFIDQWLARGTSTDQR